MLTLLNSFSPIHFASKSTDGRTGISSRCSLLSRGWSLALSTWTTGYRRALVLASPSPATPKANALPRASVVAASQAYRGSGTPCERPRFCISKMFILKPLPMIMSPGFWSAVQGPSHLAAIVMVILPPGRAALSEVTVIV